MYGSAEPGAVVTVRLGKGGDVLQQTTAGPDGSWSLTLPLRPYSGASIVATQRLQMRPGSAESAPVELPVYELPAPQITGTQRDESTYVVTGRDAEPDGSITVATEGGEPIETSAEIADDGSWSVRFPITDGLNGAAVVATQTSGEFVSIASNSVPLPTFTRPDPPTVLLALLAADDGLTVTALADSNASMHVYLDDGSHIEMSHLLRLQWFATLPETASVGDTIEIVQIVDGIESEPASAIIEGRVEVA